MNKKIIIKTFGMLSLLMLLHCTVAEASSGTGISVWETPLENIKNSLTGPVARFISMIIICTCGFAIANGQTPGVVKLIAGAVMGLSVALNAATIMDLFGTGAILLNNPYLPIIYH